MNPRQLFVAALAAGALFSTACDDDDPAAPNEPTTFDVALTRAAEVPVCVAAGATAAGTADITISADNTTITVSLTFAGLSGAATMAHIHFGDADEQGPAVINFGANPTSPFNDTFTAADYPSPVPDGAPATFAAFINQMKTGHTYINVHSAACVPGEIRGQLVADN